ncbi:hypothetical protein TUM4261_02990 [Shewanella sp. c952]|nr:hypothetical protein TUM4261_02990 [Shewanella sp. c952]
MHAVNYCSLLTNPPSIQAIVINYQMFELQFRLLNLTQNNKYGKKSLIYIVDINDFNLNS